jgi:hypothetical protein
VRASAKLALENRKTADQRLAAPPRGRAARQAKQGLAGARTADLAEEALGEEFAAEAEEKYRGGND